MWEGSRSTLSDNSPSNVLGPTCCCRPVPSLFGGVEELDFPICPGAGGVNWLVGGVQGVYIGA